MPLIKEVEAKTRKQKQKKWDSIKLISFSMVKEMMTSLEESTVWEETSSQLTSEMGLIVKIYKALTKPAKSKQTDLS